MNVVLQRTVGLLLLIAAAVVFVGCGIFDARDGEIRPLESKVLFAIKDFGEQWRQMGDPDFYLYLSTEKAYPCHGCKVLSKVKVVRDTISIELLGIYIPPKCDDSPQRAKSQMVLNVPDGNYTVLFLYGTVVDSHKLSITPSSIKIAEINAYLTEPLFSVLQR